jgi:hypothetical protein
MPPITVSPVVFFLAAAIMCFRPVFYHIVCHHSCRHGTPVGAKARQRRGFGPDS